LENNSVDFASEDATDFENYKEDKDTIPNYRLKQKVLI
jgi:hypothetical protein